MPGKRAAAELHHTASFIYLCPKIPICMFGDTHGFVVVVGYRLGSGGWIVVVVVVSFSQIPRKKTVENSGNS